MHVAEEVEHPALERPALDPELLPQPVDTAEPRPAVAADRQAELGLVAAAVVEVEVVAGPALGPLLRHRRADKLHSPARPGDRQPEVVPGDGSPGSREQLLHRLPLSGIPGEQSLEVRIPADDRLPRPTAGLGAERPVVLREVVPDGVERRVAFARLLASEDEAGVDAGGERADPVHGVTGEAVEGAEVGPDTDGEARPGVGLGPADPGPRVFRPHRERLVVVRQGELRRVKQQVGAPAPAPQGDPLGRVTGQVGGDGVRREGGTQGRSLVGGAARAVEFHLHIAAKCVDPGDRAEPGEVTA